MLTLYLTARPTTLVLLYDPLVDGARVHAYVLGIALFKGHRGLMKGRVQRVHIRPFIKPKLVSKQDHLRAGVWQLGKKVLDTILLACPLVALAPGLK